MDADSGFTPGWYNKIINNVNIKIKRNAVIFFDDSRMIVEAILSSSSGRRRSDNRDG